jgi:hypothetical protein
MKIIPCLRIALRALAAVIVLIVFIGLLLPKAHRATRSAFFHQPPEAIFAAITGPQDWRGVVKTELSSPAAPRQWREQSGRNSITFEEAASDPPRLYRSRIVDKNLPFGGTWTWEITPAEGGCVCRITEDGEIYNPVFRFVSRFILGQTKTIDDYLNALGKKFGAAVAIEP